ncbi:FliI/YscN family ATPase [Yoonia sp. 2307UL14-13]|uniref:FliI/YscN family ATPase n=1 Tax=Yoonia sp. 2307UL14-13 TaxID=3126506 RepID=UPI0030A6D276
MSALAEKLSDLTDTLGPLSFRKTYGQLTKVRGPLLCADFAGAKQGSICTIERGDGSSLLAEVIGIDGDGILLSPYGDSKGLNAGARLSLTNSALRIATGKAVLGRVLDGFGNALDDLGALPEDVTRRPIKADPPSAMDRPLIEKPLPTGIRAIDGLMTLGRGQRVGIFGPPGTGKSTLLAAIARHTTADVIVIGLIGERGREVREFVDRDLPAEARGRVVVVAATSDRPAVERALCAHSATAVAEGFRDQGASVLLLIDSLTRTARALREIGLAAGEPPTRRGFPASVYPALPAIIERAGRSNAGDITALYTVLQEGEKDIDPIAEEVKSLTDGHFLLSRKLAEAGHYPALDVVESLSRSMTAIVPIEHTKAAARIRGLLAKYRDIELLLQLGEYHSGNDPETDGAISAKPQIDAFLQQDVSERSDFTAVLPALQAVAR